MNAVLEAIDQRIEAAKRVVETAHTGLTEAQALRRQLEEERRQASGRLAAGDATAAPDLDRLRGAYLAAVGAVQAAQCVVAAARARVEPLKTERKKAEPIELAAHLGPLLAVREALATQLEAQAVALAHTVDFYIAIVGETTGLGQLLGPIGSDVVNRIPETTVSRRLHAILLQATKGQIQYYSPRREASLEAQDTEGQARLRHLVAEALARVESPSA